MDAKKNRKEEWRRGYHSQMLLHLKHKTTGDAVSFKRYLHKGDWLWRDSRDKNPCHEMDIMRETARLLCKGDENIAHDIWMAILTQQPLEVALPGGRA